ncbi:MAG: hypothetical protein N838_32270 [Thiohalocapsa sp. PB-PSB1]|nr:MAG: hypothetical protein N838_32270 [Thiohalocapsa sp. PB-PSB1]
MLHNRLVTVHQLSAFLLHLVKDVASQNKQQVHQTESNVAKAIHCFLLGGYPYIDIDAAVILYEIA